MKEQSKKSVFWLVLAAGLVLLALVLRFAAHVYTPAYVIGIAGICAGTTFSARMPRISSRVLSM